MRRALSTPCRACGFRRAAPTIAIVVDGSGSHLEVRDGLCLDCAEAREKREEVVDGEHPPG